MVVDALDSVPCFFRAFSLPSHADGIYEASEWIYPCPVTHMDPPFPNRFHYFPLLLLVAAQAYGQEYSFRQFSVDQGLSQSTVNAILQDHDGFLWFGTQDGLNKFDGYSFLVYRHDAEDSTSISDNYISCLLEDRRGTLWVGTYAGGLNCFDRERNVFAHYQRPTTAAAGISGNNVTGIAEDSSGALWIGVWGGGVDRLDPGTGEWKHLGAGGSDGRSLSNGNVRSLLIDRKGTVWIGTWNGLDALDPATGTVRHFRNDGRDPTTLPENRIVALFEAKDGSLWVSTYSRGLARFDPSNGTFLRYRAGGGAAQGLSSDHVGMIAQDQTGVLWISTRGGGITLLDVRSGLTRHIQHRPDETGGLRGEAIFSTYCDRTGGVWIGTDGSGVQHYDAHRQRFSHLQHLQGNAMSLSNAMVRSVCEDRAGRVWVGSMGGGLDSFDPRSGRWKHFTTTSNPRIGYNCVLAIMEDSRGSLWVGTDGGGISVFDRDRCTVRHYRSSASNPHALASDYIMTFAEGRNGSIWVGTSGGGLNRFDRQTGHFERYLRTAEQKGQLSGNYVWAICEDGKGFLWLGTWGGGLNRLDRSSGLFTGYRHDPADPKSLVNNTVYCITQGSDSALWIGTGGGLDRFDASAGTFTHVTEKDGLPNNVISGILPDGAGNLWLSTNRGLCRYTPANRAVLTFDASDGLQSNEFNQGAYCKGAGGKMYFGGINGVSVFDPAALAVNDHPPPVVITGCSVFDRAIPISHPAPDGMLLRLEHGDNYLSFSFSALSYTAPEKNKFAYRLEGFDKEWVAAGTRRYAAYTNLDPGEYVFRVKAANNDGLWNDRGTTLRVSIRPAVWQTTWFRALGAAVAIVALLLLYRRRTERFRRERTLEEGYTRRFNEFQEQERKDLAGTLHDSLGQELLLLKNELTLLAGTSDVTPPIGEKLRSLGSSVQQAIDDVRDISYDLHPHTLDRLGLQKALVSMVRKCEQASTIKFTAEIASLGGMFSHIQEINIFRLLQEALNNVVRHSQASSCTVEVRPTGSELLISVKDDGVGFEGEKLLDSTPEGARGYGLTSMTERARLLRGS